MSDVRFRPRSASEIVDAAFQLYRRDAQDYLMMSAVAYAPMLVVQVLIAVLGLSATKLVTGDVSAAVAGALLLGIGSVVAYALMSAVIVRYGADAYHGRPAEVGAALRDVLPRLPGVLGAALLKGLVVMLGFFLFLVGAIYFSARYFAVVQLVVLERRGVGAAFTRSSALSTGQKKHVLGTLGLVFLIYFIASLAVSMLAFGNPVLTIVLGAVYSILAYPLIGLTEMLLYYDTRIRGEGYDIEMMAGSLDGAPVAPPVSGATL